MIEVTRLNGHALLLNSDLIRYAEAAPDTTISLVTGEKLIVLESCEQLMSKVAAYRASLLREVALQSGPQAVPRVDATLRAHAAAQAHTTHLLHVKE